MNDTTTLIFNIVTCVLSMGSIAFSIVTFINNVHHNRKKDTLDAFARLQNEVFDPLNRIEPKQIREIARKPRSEEYKTITGYIARFEQFCAGVEKGIYDRKVVYVVAHGYLDSDQFSRRVTPFLEQKNQSGKREYYRNTKEVLAWMGKQKSKV